MKFSRLRLSGFKSFVDATELHIEPGLTGVVGPNGCGKSNLLEALRWVMGENSYKNMRASGMDDVIFSGTAGRPARNMAEVTLTLDNSDRSAPPAFNDDESLEVSRRIEREAGSAYRINAKDVRARDVQLLFADASTGARSPALVRQGQIGEIINSKPQARRRILEEAAGITGLHTRRHEAELKLRAAETNLTRLDDVVAQLESQLQSLKRQARQAVRYKQLSADIRRLEAAGLYMAWHEACEALQEEKSSLTEVSQVVAGFTSAVSEKTRGRDQASDALPKLREAETVRAAVLQRLTLEREDLEREEARAQKRREELEARLTQIGADLQREQEIVGDTDGVLKKLDAEEAELNSGLGNDAEQRRDAATKLQAAADSLAKAQENADEISAEVSALSAKQDAARRTRDELQNRLAKLERESQDVVQRQQDLAAKLGPDSEAQAIQASIADCEAAANAAEAAVAQAENDLNETRQTEAETRRAFDEARRKAESLSTEVRTLTKLLKVADGDLWPPVIDALKVERGFETALGAALGDDIDASTDEAAPVHWRALPDLGTTASLPDGAQPLSELVDAPDALKRRLSHIGVVEADAGAHLQPQLEPGQRLVSKNGDLWRWDGFSAGADAPTAAAQRLAERNRLDLLQIDQQQAERESQMARDGLDAARARMQAANTTNSEGRKAWKQARVAMEEARKAGAAHDRRMSESRQQISALEEAARRIESGLSETREALEAAEGELQNAQGLEDLRGKQNAARDKVNEERNAYSEARARHDGLEREAQLRANRVKAISSERDQWRERSKRAGGQIEALGKREESTRKELEDLRDVPKAFEGKRIKLMNALSEAEAGRREAADALAQGEEALKVVENDVREAEGELGKAREEQARLQARIEAGDERRKEIEARIVEVLECPPNEIAARTGIEPEKLPEKTEVDRQLQQLRDQRERLGGVNLRAEEEAEAVTTQLDEIATERDDLIQAIGKLRGGIASLNKEGRARLLEAFDKVNESFGRLFTSLFAGGKAELQLIESDDPLEAGLELLANPPGKRPQVLSLLSGGEQALTAMALIFAVFLTNPSPICVLDEVDAPLDDHNVERFCNLLDAMLQETDTRFLIITHHALTMARMNRLFGVTMMERGVSQLVSVDLQTAEALREAS